MSVLVTGGAGYIGSHMVHALVDAGETVVVLDNLSTGFWWALPGAATLVVGDMGDEALVGRVLREHGVEAIVHFAAKIVVPDSVADPLGYYLNNTVKSRALIAAAVAGGVKNIIFSSTAAVYGEVDTKPVAEDAPTEPVSPYGRSKLMTEWMLQDTARAHPISYVALRYFNVAGADPKGRTGQSTPQATHLIKVACQAALGDRPKLEVFGTDYPTPDGSCLRDYIQVSDLADAHLAALRYLRAGGESRLQLRIRARHVGPGGDRRGEASFRYRFPGCPVAAPAGDPAAIVARADKIRTLLGWTPRHDDLPGIVAQALAWERHLKARNAS